MSGFDISGGRIVITNGARTVATTGGTLLQFMTGAQAFSANLVYPDASKGELYQWRGSVQRATGDQFHAERTARSIVGALPQEWSDTVVLGAAPSGADLFIGRANLVRTVAPSHNWYGSPIAPAVPQGVDIQLTGSMLVELAFGLTRALTIDIVSGNLVALLEHSVGPAAGNFVASGTVPMVSPSTSIPPNNLNVGYENVAVSGAGIPVFWQDVAPYYLDQQRNAHGSISSDANSALYANYARKGWPDQVTYSDPTNYSSTYALSVSGRFGRRS